MAFKKQDPVMRNPHIRSLTITIRKNIIQDDIDSPGGVSFRIRIEDQDDELMKSLDGNLAPHLTPAQKTALQNFMDVMWAKAEEEVIG